MVLVFPAGAELKCHNVQTTWALDTFQGLKRLSRELHAQHVEYSLRNTCIRYTGRREKQEGDHQNDRNDRNAQGVK